MPGHKGVSRLGWEPFDLTEIKGADELYEAEGIIEQSEENATALFETVHTYYSTEGSSQCIRAMLCLALRAAPQTGTRPVLLAARNAHKALLYAAALLDFDIRWLWPAPEEAGALCSCPVTPAALEQTLTETRKRGICPFGVYVTSPDYLGGVQDIAGLAAVCKKKNVPLLVDNAHGAYLHFLPDGSRHPIALGAAMCCDSGHKTLSVVTGGAYLHLGPDAPVQEESAVRSALALFGSTSPSYLILQSLDMCNAVLAGDWTQKLGACCAALEALRRDLNETAFSSGAALPLALPGNTSDREPLKLTLDAAALELSGGDLAECLRAHRIECEYADPRYVVLMFTPDNQRRDYIRLQEAVTQVCAEFAATGRTAKAQGQEMPAAPDFSALEQELLHTPPRCTIRESIFAPQEQVRVEDALGRICAMPTVSCPPAIPIVVSGEVVTETAIRLMRRYGVGKVAVVK